MHTNKKIGFIGQGWIGKNYADEFEHRGFTTVRYAKESPYNQNKSAVTTCDIVFIAVPTPTTPEGFDDSIIHAVLPLVGQGKIAVLKSTIVPGTTARLQNKFPGITILYSPEFLSEATAVFDTANPFASIVGVSQDTEEQRICAQEVLDLLPKAPFSLVCTSTEAEIFKYSHNTSGFIQIMFFNMMYDFATQIGSDWSVIRTAIMADPFMAHKYSEPIHKSGRGAGGHCFIKDFEAFTQAYIKILPHDVSGATILQANIDKNIGLLKVTNKDLDILKGVYGDGIM